MGSKADSTTLNKENFNSMSIQEQIQIINQFIKAGDSINNIAKMLGYDETTLRDRYKRAGYSRVSRRGIFVVNDVLEAERAKKANEQVQKTIKAPTKKKNIETTDNKGANKMNKKETKKESSKPAIAGQESLLNTIELGDNLFKLTPAKEGKYSTAPELNNAVKRNINIRTNKELSRKLLTIYNFLTAVEPEAGDTINYTSIITGALSLYFDKLKAEYGEEFSKYVITAEAEQVNNKHHKAIAELINMINEK